MANRPFVMVSCKSHNYYFIYSKGDEEKALATMVEYAIDPRYNFGWTELRSIARHALKMTH